MYEYHGDGSGARTRDPCVRMTRRYSRDPSLLRNVFRQHVCPKARRRETSQRFFKDVFKTSYVSILDFSLSGLHHDRNCVKDRDEGKICVHNPPPCVTEKKNT